MNIHRVLMTVALLFSLSGMNAIADEAVAASGKAQGVVERLDLKHGTARIGGETYRISPDVELMDVSEGGTMELRGLRIGSKVSIQFRNDEKRPVVFYIEVHEMPLK